MRIAFDASEEMGIRVIDEFKKARLIDKADAEPRSYTTEPWFSSCLNTYAKKGIILE